MSGVVILLFSYVRFTLQKKNALLMQNLSLKRKDNLELRDEKTILKSGQG